MARRPGRLWVLSDAPFSTFTAMHTPLTKLLAIQHPIVQAPLGSATTPELAAAVSNAGGLGMLALSWADPAQARAQIRRTKALTDRPFGVNLVLVRNYDVAPESLPHRKPRRSKKTPATALTDTQRAENHAHARRRVKVESKSNTR